MITRQFHIPIAFSAVIFVVIALCCMTCSKKATNSDPVPSLCVSPIEIPVDGPGGLTDTIHVDNCGTTTSVPWSASSNVAWAHATPTSGTTPGWFIITYDTNRTAYRVGEITVTSSSIANAAPKVAVKQLPMDAQLCVSPLTWNVPPAGADTTLNITNCGNASAIDWFAYFKPDWVTESDSTGTTPSTLTLTVDSNKTGIPRIDTVVITTCFNCFWQRVQITQQPLASPWTSLDTIPGGVWGHGAAAYDNKLYIYGGTHARSGGNTALRRYDPVTNLWTSALAQTQTGFRDNFASGFINGTLYLAGGISYNNLILDTVEAYSVVSNVWSIKTSMPLGLSGAPGATVSGKFYMVGGFNYAQTYSAVRIYDPVTNAWSSTVNGMSVPRYNLAVAVVNGKLYAIGGFASGGASSTVDEYDPVLNAWTTKAPMPTFRYALAAVTVNNRIYAIGGMTDENTPLNTVEEYNPATNTWKTKTPMPTKRGYVAAATIGTKAYVVGGNTAWPPQHGNASSGWVSGAVEVYEPLKDTLY